MSTERRGRFALELESADGGRRGIGFGWFGLALLVTVGVVSATFLVLGLAELPRSLSSSLQSRETEVLLARRVQLGERLRLLVARYERLEEQVGEHERHLQRIRRLYGLPALTNEGRPPQGAPPPSGTIFTAALLHVGKLAARIDQRISSSESLLVSLLRWEDEHEAEVSSFPAALPIRSPEVVPTALFGPGREPFGGELEFHAGIDLAAPLGTAILAPAPGVVRWAGEAPPSSGGPWWRLGRTVVVAHGSSLRTLFGHSDKVLVRSGQRGEAGQAIATVGDSGRALSPRLHYEVRRRDADGAWQAIDPISVLLDLDRLERELGTELAARPEIDASSAPPLPPSYAR